MLLSRLTHPMVLVPALLVSLTVGASALPPDSPVPAPSNLPIALHIDASNINGKLIHAQMSLPVSPGALTLVYPKWIPGEHGPTGPVDNIAGLTFTGSGRTIPWRRDLREMFSFHLTIPAGVHSLEMHYDFLLSGDTSGFSASGLTTPNLVNINWNQLVFYPSHCTADKVTVTADLRLPAGWQYGTALPVNSTSGTEISFLPAPLVTLIDSPVLAGKYFRRIVLTDPGINPSHEIDMASDSPGSLEMPPSEVQHYRNLVAETGPLFGVGHYRDYHFLYTLSSHVASFGLEHHESSDDRVGERTLLDPHQSLLNADLLPHEFVHSWNGKYRRPYDLYTVNYQKPMQDDLLWVYEGLTQYYGKVLTARAGLWTAQQYEEQLAGIGAQLDHEAGREWRPLQDTADDAQNAYNSPDNWANYRRGTDFYDEGVLIWLEADTIIRTQTHNQKSLDDFCRVFYGGSSGMPLCKTYTFADIVQELTKITPYDWTAFLMQRLTQVGTRAPLGGIINSGWKVAYTDTPTEYSQAIESVSKSKLFNFSLGMTVGEEGSIGDVFPNMPAFQAGLAPGMKVIAVNGHAYSDDRLQDAILASKATTTPLEIIAENGDIFQTYEVNYHGGMQYAHLERDLSKPDLLSAIIASRTAPALSAPVSLVPPK